MRIEKRVKMTAILEDDVKVFEERFNEVMSSVPDKYEITWNLNQGHCCYVTWDEEVRVPETAEDRYLLANHRQCSCEDCPYMEWNQDRRKRHHWCSLHEKTVYQGEPACEIFYNRKEKGTI